MEKMKRNKLALALTAALGLGAAATNVQAINIAENGVGDWAYNPYFSVTKAQDQFINIVNTSENTVAAKIVFRRGTDSVEVRDFIIILSPKDVWTGRISPVVDPNGAITNAKVVTSDQSCTVPNKPDWNAEAGGFSVPFDTSLFGSSVVVPSSNVLPGYQSQLIQDIKEGYFTVAVMGVATSVTSPDVFPNVAYLAKHVNGVPRDCATIASNWDQAIASGSILGQFPISGNVLRVSSIMIDAASNLAMGVPVTTLANAFDQGHPNTSADDNPKEPDMTSTVNVFNSNTAILTSGSADKPERAVSAVLMADSVYGTYDFTGGTSSSWVVNFPTKRSLMAIHTDISGSAAPFNDSVVSIGISSWDNEEAVQQSQTSVRFSPYVPPVIPGFALPYEVNVIKFTPDNASQNPLASLLGTDVPQVYTNGWMQLGFPQAVPVTVTGTKVSTFTGMPVIGFEYFENGGFSAANPLGYSKNIQ